ncbi:MAG: response regulator, partial [Candidatus Marinimicrobia bacterium]|nr:response regulator [Candidatus Neomarinimicrobiota bacterium]
VKAFSNLVDNAIKYTVEGQIKIGLNEENGKFVLSISDTGIGMSPDYLNHLYDAFSQESTGYNKKYQGLGLGLSIAKSCLDMNAIPIAVESKQGVGTTFSLTFTPADMVIAEPEVKISPTDTKTEKITSKVKPVVLLVEDDLHNRRALEVILNQKYETPYAVSVEEAKKQLREYKVELIILDLSLEGDEDGLDLVAYMKAKKRLKDIPVIAVTAHAFPTDRENVLNAGCDDYMSKPIDIKKLLEMISEYC